MNQLKTALGHAETPSKDIDCSMIDSGLYDDFAQKLQIKKIHQGIGDTADSGFENGNLNDGHNDGMQLVTTFKFLTLFIFNFNTLLIR